MASIDPKTLADLRAVARGAGPGFLAELIDLYLRDAAGHVRAIRAAVDARDAALLERTAHTLKGAGGNLGARALAALCAELQAVARRPDWTRAADLAARVEREHEAAAAELAAEKSR